MHRTKTSRLASLLLLAACLAGLAWCKRHHHGFSVDAASSAASSSEDFVATAEWRTVAPGQRIPPGLHVRMNIQTGATEARLLDKSASSASDDAKNLPVLVASSSSSPSDAASASAKPEADSLLRRTLSSQEMKAALKKIKAESVSQSPESEEDGEVKRKFRSYDDLKADFAKLNAAVKTDLEVLQGLLAELRQPDCPLPVRLRILGEFEYHLRQVDNAQNFVLMGGLELLMGEANATVSAPAANATERASAALRALAASCQGNAPVQVAALKAGFLPLLMRIVHHAEDARLRSLGVLALASVCRNFPHAQAVLLKSGGLAALKAAFQLAAAADTDGGDRTRLRVITLLADLAHEAAESSAAATPDSPDVADAASERRRQYEQVGAARAIAESGWCSLLPRPLLSLGGDDSAAAIDHDAAEKSVVAMATLVDACGGEFADDAAVGSALGRLAARYQRLAEAELAGDGEGEGDEAAAAAGEEGFFCQLRDRIAELRQRLDSQVAARAAQRSEL